MATIGFVGLGNMGAQLAANLVAAGHHVLAHDLAGPGLCPEGAEFVDDLAALSSRTTAIVCSLPDGAASHAVATAIAATPDRAVTHVVDTSTVGPAASAAIAAALEPTGIGYVDAPVSGGVDGARARTLAVMVAGRPTDRDAVGAVLDGLSDRRYVVGDRPGMAQALKLANNLLAATALAATSEAVAFCTAAGLDMATVLEVVNASSGRSGASEDKFVHHVLTGTYASGFLNTLMAKDLDLSLDERGAAHAPIGAATAALWRSFAEQQPRTDFTAIYKFVAQNT